MAYEHAAWCLLSQCERWLFMLFFTASEPPSQDTNTQPSLFGPLRVTPRLEKANVFETRLPGWSEAVPGYASHQLGAKGWFALAYCELSQCFFLCFIKWHWPQNSKWSASASSLCLITAQQLGFIHPASVISVKCFCGSQLCHRSLSGMLCADSSFALSASDE